MQYGDMRCVTRPSVDQGLQFGAIECQCWMACRMGKFLELEHNATLVCKTPDADVIDPHVESAHRSNARKSLTLTQRPEETNNVKRMLTHLHRDDVQVLALNEKWFWSAHQLLLAYKICLKNGGADIGGGDSPTAGFLAIYSLMHVCHSLHVYGFSSEKTRTGACFTARPPR
eukprot:1196297-Prorocentrum_minimum.AAC.7